jgi:hypothetical protein
MSIGVMTNERLQVLADQRVSVSISECAGQRSSAGFSAAPYSFAAAWDLEIVSCSGARHLEIIVYYSFLAEIDLLAKSWRRLR